MAWGWNPLGQPAIHIWYLWLSDIERYSSPQNGVSYLLGV